jgi:transposase
VPPEHLSAVAPLIARSALVDRFEAKPDQGYGYTVRDVARRYRVGEDKVRGWIRRGELRAINTATVRCGKARYVILPEALAEFERSRAAAEPPKPPKRRRRTTDVDFYPD